MRRAAVAVLVILAVVPLSAAEKWYEAYNRGVKAVNAKNYDAAIDAIQKSLAEMPNEGTSVRARNEIITYLPHFWLGIARFNLGDLDGALREWKTSEDQGAIQNTDYYARMRDWVARAQAEKHRLAQNASADARKAADAAVSRAMSSSMDALAAGGDRSEAYRQGQRKLQEAIAQFNKAGTDSRAYQRAGDTAGQARDLFLSAAEEAKRARAARPAATPKTQPPVEVSRVQVEPQKQQPAPQPVKQAEAPKVQPQVVQEVPKPQPPPAQTPPAQEAAPVESEALVAARVALQEYRGRVATATNQRRDDRKFQQALRDAGRDAAELDAELQKKHDEPTIKRTVEFVESRQRELDALLTMPAPAQRPPQDAKATRQQLESAYRALARGDLDGAEAMLTRIITENTAAEAFLLRGCTRYVRAALSKTPDRGMGAAADDFRAALKLNRALRLEKSAFSPKLVAYFDSVRTGAKK